MINDIEQTINNCEECAMLHPGRHFFSEFDAFCNNNNIKHELSSPYNPSSNGLAEQAAKTAKKILTFKKLNRCGDAFLKKGFLPGGNVLLPAPKVSTAYTTTPSSANPAGPSYITTRPFPQAHAHSARQERQ